MTAPLDRGLLRQAGLSSFDVQVISLLAKNGEQPYYAERARPEVVARMNLMIERDLIEASQLSPGRFLIRLTDFGRSAAAQIEAMDAAPKIQVASRA